VPKLGLSVKKQFLFIGRIHPIKAVENLIQAIDLSHKFKEENYHLIVAGNERNSYGVMLKKLVEDLSLKKYVTFVGPVESEQKFKLYAESFFMVLPSHSENFANVVTESFGQGTPVIASHGTPWKILEEQKAGFHVANTPDSLAQALDRAILLEKSTYQAYRENALKVLQESFDMKKGVESWIEAYENALSQHRIHR
jgi:glycosyltransferase involved in cell wall biosynthesis